LPMHSALLAFPVSDRIGPARHGHDRSRLG
jgi:hypothetical protein